MAKTSYTNYCKIRDEKNMKDVEVARATGISPATFSLWKSGRNDISLGVAIALSEYFKVPIEAFIDRS